MTRSKRMNKANEQSTIPAFLNPQCAQFSLEGNSHQPHGELGTDRSLKVDSWRSYRNDTTKLQSLADAQSMLNATAADFVPNIVVDQPATASASYQSLRDLSGLIERTTIYSSRVSPQANRQYSTAFASRYPTRSAQGSFNNPISIEYLPDHPLPSIENDVDYVPIPLAKRLRNAKKQSKIAESLLQPPRIESRRSTTVEPPQPPKSTDAYLADASKPPGQLSTPKKLLVILDLNGTLVYRRKASTYSNPLVRPGVPSLMEYLFNNHAVMIYTSATPESAQRMINYFLHPSQRNKLVAVWARDQLGLSKQQYRSKVQVYKNLDKVWKSEEIQKTANPGCRWNQSNTVLIDDSKLKALAQPFNLVQTPEYTKGDIVAEGKLDQKSNMIRLTTQLGIMQRVQDQLEQLRHQENVSRQIRMWTLNEIEKATELKETVTADDDTDYRSSYDPSLEYYSDKNGNLATRPRIDYLPTPQSMDDHDDNRPLRHSSSSPSASDADEETGGMSTLNASNRSVSPITEDVFKELLGDKSK